MATFLSQVEQLLQVASAESDGELVPADLALMIDRRGTIQMMDASGWQTQSLREYAGAKSVYRIRKSGDRIRIEASSGPQRCVVESERPHSGRGQEIADCFPIALEGSAAAGSQVIAGGMYRNAFAAAAYRPEHYQLHAADILEEERPFDHQLHPAAEVQRRIGPKEGSGAAQVIGAAPAGSPSHRIQDVIA